jgi:hypothetical protein
METDTKMRELRDRVTEIADTLHCSGLNRIDVRQYRLLEKAVMDLVRSTESLAPKARVSRKSTTFYRHWVEHAYDDDSVPWLGKP